MNDIDARRQQIIAEQSSKSGLRGKVNAKCCECIFDPDGGGGNWRQQVEACTSYSCPLYSVRPISKKKGAGDTNMAALAELTKQAQELEMGYE